MAIEGSKSGWCGARRSTLNYTLLPPSAIDGPNYEASMRVGDESDDDPVVYAERADLPLPSVTAHYKSFSSLIARRLVIIIRRYDLA